MNWIEIAKRDLTNPLCWKPAKALLRNGEFYRQLCEFLFKNGGYFGLVKRGTGGIDKALELSCLPIRQFDVGSWIYEERVEEMPGIWRPSSTMLTVFPVDLECKSILTKVGTISSWRAPLLTDFFLLDNDETLIAWTNEHDDELWVRSGSTFSEFIEKFLDYEMPLISLDQPLTSVVTPASTREFVRTPSNWLSDVDHQISLEQDWISISEALRCGSTYSRIVEFIMTTCAYFSLCEKTGYAHFQPSESNWWHNLQDYEAQLIDLPHWLPSSLPPQLLEPASTRLWIFPTNRLGRKILKSVGSLDSWRAPLPMDLAFYTTDWRLLGYGYSHLEQFWVIKDIAADFR